MREIIEIVRNLIIWLIIIGVSVGGISYILAQIAQIGG